MRSARAELVPSLRDGAGASRGPRTLRTHRVLLVAESTLAVLLLIGAALMGRSFVNLMQVDTGYDPSHVLTARVYLPGADRGEADTSTLVAELLPRLRSLAGVTAAGAANMAPFSRSTYVSAFQLPLPGQEAVTVRTQSYVVTTGYAESLALRLRAGRLLNETDMASAVPPVLVNDQFVRMFVGQTDPIGRRFEGQFGTSEIVGVVATVLKDSLEQEPQAEMYMLATGKATIRREVYLVMRTTGDPVAYATTSGALSAICVVMRWSRRWSRSPHNSRRRWRSRDSPQRCCSPLPASRSCSPPSASTACSRTPWPAANARSACAARSAPPAVGS
jgi:hypothetical protein